MIAALMSTSDRLHSVEPARCHYVES